MNVAVLVSDFQNALLSSDADGAAKIVEKYAKQYSSPLLFIEEIVVKALDHIGVGWETGDYALSQVYMSGRICEDLLDKMLPDESGQRREKPKMAIALLHDYHSLGKKIVYSVLRAGGYQLLDYGRIEVDDLVDRIREDRLELILISVLMLSSALQVKEIVRSLSHASGGLKVVVGGAPFRLDRQLWQEVGADAVGYTASDALHIVKTFKEGKEDE